MKDAIGAFFAIKDVTVGQTRMIISVLKHTSRTTGSSSTSGPMKIRLTIVGSPIGKATTECLVTQKWEKDYRDNLG